MSQQRCWISRKSLSAYICIANLHDNINITSVARLVRWKCLDRLDVRTDWHKQEESSSGRRQKIVLLRKEINHCVSPGAPAGEIKEEGKNASALGCWWEDESATTVTFKQLLEAISQIWFASLSGKSWPRIHKDITLHPVSAAIHGSSHFPRCCCYGSYYLHPTRKSRRELKNSDLMMLLYACVRLTWLKLKCVISAPLAA